MASPAKRINLTLDDEHAYKLALLSTALDDADPDATRITEILDAIPGAWERTQEGMGQAARGEGKPLDDLI